MRTFDYAKLAGLFDYPDAHYIDRVKSVRDDIATRCPEAARSLDQVLELLPRNDLRALQELHTRSFDVQALTTLDLGYVLFGDDYKRGELLSNLMREHRLANNDCHTELGDHLPNVIRLLPLLTDAEVVEELVQEIIVPALRKMIGEFDPARLEKKDEMYHKHYKTVIEANFESRLAFRGTLEALYAVLGTDFVLVATPLLTQTADFLASIGTEMKIENDNELAQPAAE